MPSRDFDYDDSMLGRDDAIADCLIPNLANLKTKLLSAHPDAVLAAE